MINCIVNFSKIINRCLILERLLASLFGHNIGRSNFSGARPLNRWCMWLFRFHKFSYSLHSFYSSIMRNNNLLDNKKQKAIYIYAKHAASVPSFTGSTKICSGYHGHMHWKWAFHLGNAQAHFILASTIPQLTNVIVVKYFAIILVDNCW